MKLIDLAAAVETARPLDRLPTPDEARAIRTSAGVNLAVAGAVMGVSGATVARWETGANVPRLTAAMKYRRLLSVLSGGGGK